MPLVELLGNRIFAKGMSGFEVRQIQLALRANGQEVVADGEFGIITETAVRDFQQKHGLSSDGVVGEKTAEILDKVFDAKLQTSNEVEVFKPSTSSLLIAPWLSVMRALTGTKEVLGSKDSPVILSWVKDVVTAYPDLQGTVGWYDHDSVPWCGLCAAYCVTKSGYKPPKLALGALNWFNDWEDGVTLKTPSLGAIGVKKRLGGGHVWMYEGEDESFFYARAGNQSDMVNVAKIAKNSDVLGFMWPKSAPLPTSGRVYTSFSSAQNAASES